MSLGETLNVAIKAARQEVVDAFIAAHAAPSSSDFQALADALALAERNAIAITMQKAWRYIDLVGP
jgi:hypothetical protein